MAPFVWLQFALCAAVIWVAGVRLSRYGDVIAEKSGAGRAWIGLVLLAGITSLPELVTGLSAVTLANAPDIAAGDVLGSCVFNLVILVVVDLIHRHAPFYTRARRGHILSAAFGVILLGVVGFDILLLRLGAELRFGAIGLSSPILVVIYLVAMRVVYRYEIAHRAEYGDDERIDHPARALTLGQAIAAYLRWALVIVAGGAWLPFVGEQIAELMGWHRSFVGTLLVAGATSLPEIVVTIAAVRMGALDLAIGNLFGSNLFNMVVLAINDLAYPGGPLLAVVSPVHAVSALSALIMTGVAIVGLVYRPPSRLFHAVGWASLVLLALYLLNAWILFHHGARPALPVP